MNEFKETGQWAPLPKNQVLLAGTIDPDNITSVIVFDPKTNTSTTYQGNELKSFLKQTKKIM